MKIIAYLAASAGALALAWALLTNAYVVAALGVIGIAIVLYVICEGEK